MQLLLLTAVGSIFSSAALAQRIRLAGSLKICLGSPAGKEYAIQLPGTLDDYGIGDSLQVKSTW